MIPYSLHVALLLAFCLAFYKLLLQKETYYKLNRWLLLGCIALSFLLPLITVPQKLSLRSIARTQAVEQVKPPFTVSPSRDTNTEETATFDERTNPRQNGAQLSVVAPAEAGIQLNRDNIIKWGMWLYWAGVAIFAGNFLLQIAVLIYRSYKKPVIRDGIYRIVELDDDQAPCSFGNSIFINPTKYDWDTYTQILLHEKEHVKQGHTFDLILAELMLILQWFNPFAWLYRKEVESNLEFLTDDAIIRNHNVQIEEYQMSLLRVSVPNYAMHVTTNYNQSLLKKRLLKMNAKRSNLHSSWKYLMLAPLLVVLVCAFNKQAISSDTDESFNSVTLPDGKEIKFRKDTTINVAEFNGELAKVDNSSKSITVKREEANDSAADEGSNFEESAPVLLDTNNVKLKTFLKDNQALVKQRKYKEVLERHIWYHDNALKYDKALVGVRLSFVLSDWKKLGELYPRALNVLNKIRDKKAGKVLNNGTPELFQDVVAIDTTLAQSYRTVELFNKLMVERPDVAKTCFRYAKEALFTAGQYSVINKYLGDPMAEFESITRSYNFSLTLLNRPAINGNTHMKAMTDEIIKKHADRNLVKRSVQLINYLVATGNAGSAKDIQQKVLDMNIADHQAIYDVKFSLRNFGSAPANIRDVKLEGLYADLKKYTLMLKPVFMNPKLGDPSIKPDLVKYDKQLAGMNIKYPAPVINSTPALKTEFEDYPNIKKQYIGYVIALENIKTYTTSPAYLDKIHKLSLDDQARLSTYIEKLGDDANRVN